MVSKQPCGQVASDSPGASELEAPSWVVGPAGDAPPPPFVAIATMASSKASADMIPTPTSCRLTRCSLIRPSMRDSADETGCPRLVATSPYIGLVRIDRSAPAPSYIGLGTFVTFVTCGSMADEEGLCCELNADEKFRYEFAGGHKFHLI